MADNNSYDPLNDDIFNQDVNDKHVNQIIGGPQKGDEEIKKDVKTEELPPVQEEPKRGLPVLPIVVVVLILVGAGAFVVMKKQKDLQAEEQLRLEQQAAEESRIQESIEQEEYDKLLKEIEEEEKNKPEFTLYTEEQVRDLLDLGMTKEQIREAEEKKWTYEECKNQLETRIKKRYFDLQKQVYENTEDLHRWTQFGTWLTYPDSVSPEKPQTYTQSCKYEKVPPYGFQTQLCIYLNVSNEYERYYITVDPVYYDSLAESNFITVSYKYRYDRGMGQYWIYDMKITDENAEERFLNYVVENGVELE